MKFDRAAGILLHPTSLPGPYGIGDIGPMAHRWLDFLANGGCSLWQVLPLGPTGYGDSPYQSFSAFAGNYYLISPEALLAEGLLHSDDVVESPGFPEKRVDFGAVIPLKLGLLDRAFNRFEHQASVQMHAELAEFEEMHRGWLDDFALFMAIKEAYGGGPWVDWPAPIRGRDPGALEQARRDLSVAISRQKFRQFLFFRQWVELRNYARDLNIKIVGDIPIFVAHDSAEVWARPELFYLNPDGNPQFMAGVPPDYFSETGQLWGNPLYRWDRHEQEGYSWWIERMRAVLQLVDIVRLDHFRGFAGYWEVPAGEKTAVKGRWAPGPGLVFFLTVKEELGDLPIIAEDLGVITQDVIDMREKLDLPGMRIIQFAFYGDPAEPFLPHNHVPNSVVYTGTHDNDTSRGWYERVPEGERDFYRRYLGRDGSNVAWDFIRAVWSSVAMFAIAPMQDFLDLGNEARMNYPGNPSGNWTWRVSVRALSESLSDQIKEFNFLYDRMNPQTVEEEGQGDAQTNTPGVETKPSN
jgi:4-alpha-glucanotransferase